MRKIPSEYENPFDNILISMSESVGPFLKKTGHTPNIITTYSFVTGLISLFLLYKNYTIGFGVFFIISYFFDCVDGNFARKYDMITELGDKYDHYTDLIVGFGIIFIIYFKFGACINSSIILSFILVFFLMTMHMGCQQHYYEADKKEMLNDLKPLCKKKEWIHYTRYFGTGTFVLYLTFIVMYMSYASKCKY